MLKQSTKYVVPSVVLALFVALSAQAQTPDPCASFIETIKEVYNGPAKEEPSGQLAVAQSALEGRICYGAADTTKTLQLLHYEVWAYDRLGRYDDAESSLDIFETYKESASAYQRADLAHYRLKVCQERGNMMGATVAWLEARQFSAALGTTDSLDLLLDGAYLYQEGESYTDAIRLASDVLAGIPDEAKNHELRNRALLLRGEARMDRDTSRASLDAAIVDMEQAMEIMRPHGGRRLHEALFILGEAYSVQGDLAGGEVLFGESIRLSKLSGDTRSEIMTLLRRGKIRNKAGRYREAELDLRRSLALSDSSGIMEVVPWLELRLADALAGQGQRRPARTLLLDLLSREALAASPFEARKLHSEARLRLLDMYRTEGGNTLPWSVAGLLAVALGVVSYLWQRKARQAHSPQSPQVRLPDISGDDKFDNRVRHIHEILEREIPPDNPALYRILDEEMTGESSRGNPVERHRKFFRGRFKKLGIAYPKTPEAWCRLLSIPT